MYNDFFYEQLMTDWFSNVNSFVDHWMILLLTSDDAVVKYCQQDEDQVGEGQNAK